MTFLVNTVELNSNWVNEYEGYTWGIDIRIRPYV